MDRMELYRRGLSDTAIARVVGVMKRQDDIQRLYRRYLRYPEARTLPEQLRRHIVRTLLETQVKELEKQGYRVEFQGDSVIIRSGEIERE